MLQTVAIEDLRSHIADQIYRAQYQAGGTWTDVAITGKSITDSGIVRVTVQISPGAVTTITGVRLLNGNGDVWAKKTVNVAIDSADTSMLQRFDFEVREEGD